MRRVTVPCLTTQALPPYKKSRIRINKYTVFSINVERITRLELGSRDFSPADFTLGKDVCEKKQRTGLPSAVFAARRCGLEAPPGFGPGVRELQSLALPLGYSAV